MSFSVQSFIDAFGGAPRPDIGEITGHRCCECNRVRDDFSQFSVADVPESVIEFHQDSIPLLTPKAFRYYLPRYVQVSCENLESDVSDMLLFSLSPDDPESEFWSQRCDEFTETEKQAIVEYLTYRKSWSDASVDSQWIEPGIEYWSNK